MLVIDVTRPVTPPEPAEPEQADPPTRTSAGSPRAGARDPDRLAGGPQVGAAEAAGQGTDPVDEPVPRLPRGRGLRLSRPELVRVAGLAVLLVFLLVTQRPCADSVSKFVTGFGEQGSGGAVMPRPGNVDLPAGSGAPAPAGSAAPADEGYEHLRPGMTDDEIKAVIERARAKRAGSASSGSGSASSGSGSASSGSAAP